MAFAGARSPWPSAAGPVRRITLKSISVQDALQAGFYRIDLGQLRPDPRIALRETVAQGSELAGLPTDAFKVNVRKLKKLGLTESLEVGYRLSPREAALLRG